MIASIEQARHLALPALRKAFEGLDPAVRQVCAYHQGWVDESGAPVEANAGKMIRPALALLSAQASGQSAETGVPAAVAVELVHAFSLLHDDIMDNSEERRHRPAAWRIFGTSMAILGGDALLAMSQSVLLAAPTPGAVPAARRLADDVQRLIGGQCADLAFERRTDVTLGEYTAMAVGKTGALMASGCAIGAELAGCPPELADALAWCGERLGVAFQIVDDILGIWGDPATTGKPVFADLRERKKTYPVIAALSAEGPAAARLREMYLQPGHLGEDRLAEAADLVGRAGGRVLADQAVAGCLAEIRRTVHGQSLPPEVRDSLLEIASMMADRRA